MVAVSKSDIITKVYTLNKTAASLIKDNGQLKMFNVISKASTIGNLFIANAARGHDIQSVPQTGYSVFFPKGTFFIYVKEILDCHRYLKNINFDDLVLILLTLYPPICLT